MKILITIIVGFISQLCFAQPKLTSLDANSLPKSIKYNGQIVHADRWKDNAGEHIVIATETGIVASKNSEEGDGSDADLYAYHYLQTDSMQLTWTVHDFIRDCNVDLKADFIKDAFAITDLDKNGKAEVWLMYKMVCHGDVSPGNMKIIMYEDNKKYAVRGMNMVKVSEEDHEGGEYSFDEAFKKAPESFRQYATKLWKKNILETWD